MHITAASDFLERNSMDPSKANLSEIIYVKTTKSETFLLEAHEIYFFLCSESDVTENEPFDIINNPPEKYSGTVIFLDGQFYSDTSFLNGTSTFSKFFMDLDESSDEYVLDLIEKTVYGDQDAEKELYTSSLSAFVLISEAYGTTIEEELERTGLAEVDDYELIDGGKIMNVIREESTLPEMPA